MFLVLCDCGQPSGLMRQSALKWQYYPASILIYCRSTWHFVAVHLKFNNETSQFRMARDTTITASEIRFQWDSDSPNN